MLSSSEIVHSASLKKEVSGYMTSNLKGKSHSASNTRRTVQQIIDTAIKTRKTDKEKDVLRWVQFCVDTCLSQQDEGGQTSKKQGKEQEKNESSGYHVIGESDDDFVPSEDDQQVPESDKKKKKKKTEQQQKPTRRKKEDDQPPFIQPNAGSKAVVSYFSSAHPVAASDKNGVASGYFAKSYFFPSKESFNVSRAQCMNHADSSFGFLQAFISVLNSARKTIDCCVFSLTDDDVADALIAAKKRNVTVRIITDNQQAAGVGADAERLQRDYGIPYKTDHT